MAGSVLSVGVMLCLTSMAVAAAAVSGASVVSQRVSGAADAAALAAADAASGAVTGAPCVRAGEVAAALDVQVVACDVAGLVATVAVQSTYLALPARASARAAPPEITADSPGVVSLPPR